MQIVYAKDWVRAPVEGSVRQFPPGSHWPADDPYVQAHPGQFSEDPRYHLAFTEVRPGYLGDEPPVEQATAAPGERRNTRRG
jgi:hypothetical protein